MPRVDVSNEGSNFEFSQLRKRVRNSPFQKREDSTRKRRTFTTGPLPPRWRNMMSRLARGC